MTSGEDLVLTEQVDGVAVISFNRPERHNAINDEMGERWRAVVRDAIADSSVRCLLLRGEGRSFSSGRDTAQLGARTAGESDFAFIRKHQDIRLELLDAPKPVLAAVKGYVFGGAFEISLAADMRIASTDASFAFPEISYGLVTDTGGSQMLPPLIGPSKTKYLLMTGQRIDAATAEAWGAVDFLVAPEELDAASLDLARRLASAPPQAAMMAKVLVDQASAGSIRNGIRQEWMAQVALFAGEEHARAKAAAIERLRADKEHRG
jgi:enoyl-CoA hydratase/carnithine racemase